ncbi:hypothetical protein [Bradyrhizobium sp. CCBAU 53380]|uniref:hypothetical protein n=1 Tax=Bradyrhizobium sp. CCBAU 53380 TaxID=1325117 RepID=UPI0023023CF5|nr:hypothetical protein [Bradyrhizobium sp. CCBAU 53380]MDA9420986.1 hypothetical protein [Bradyrhizobium sp. CCBAU 53380]
MSVINRIEIANWLDLTRTREWNPDYRHVVLDFRGQSTAVQAHNGTGKTRMTRAILALLGRDREFTGDARAKMAPRSAPSCSHIRMEVLHPHDSAQADLLQRVGEQAGGERYVLGIYGYSGDGQKVTFYKYDGKLEDCPVASRDGHRVTLTTDDAFRRGLRAAKGALIDPTEDEWLIEIGKHFDRGNVRQIIEYQKKGAGDGTSSFLKVKAKHGERYDEAFFYSVLAPELLVGTMGNEAVEGERRFEDTILISARKIGMALVESRRRQDELAETKRALDAIERVKVAASDVTAARQTYEVRCRTLAGEAAFLRTIVVERPVPGVPKSSLPGDGKTKEIAAHLKIQEDIWRLPDAGIGAMTGEEPARVNERASRMDRRGVPLARAQAIEIPVRGHATGAQTLYNSDAAAALIATAPSFAPGWSKEVALKSLRTAFEWAEAEADTNFPRKQVVSLTRQRDEGRRKYVEVEGQRKEVERQLENLHSRQRSMDAARHAYDEMARSGLFSDGELAAPAKTGALAEENFQLAEKRFDEHQQRVAAGTALYVRWNAFLSENGRDANPGSLADEIEAAKRTAVDALDQARRNQKEAERKRSGISRDLQTETRRRQEVENAVSRMAAERHQAQKFSALFPSEAVPGLLERVKRELREASDQKARLEARIAAAEGPLRQLDAFRAAFPGETAVEVSTRRARRRDEMVAICAELDKDYGDVQRRRSELERAQIAAGQVEDRILRTAGKGAEPLHAAVLGFGLSPDRLGRALTHFSGLLFAPVLATVEEADLVAKVLFSEGIPAPVLVRAELEAFCRDGNIQESDGSAYSFILGARTRPVDCLLDPDLVEREKRELEQQAARLKAELAAALQEKAALAPGHSDTRLVESARKSEEDRLEEAAAQAMAELVDVRARLPRLEERASEESVAAIRGAERYASLGGESRYDALLAEQEDVSRRLSDLERQATEAAVIFEHAELAVSNAEALFSRTAERASQVQGLRELSRFVRDGGPNFMQSAPGVGAELRKVREHARARTKFQFELAQQRVELAAGAEANLDAEIRKKSDERRDLGEAMEAHRNSEQEAQRGLDEWRPRSATLDEVARRLTSQYRIAQEVLADLEVGGDSSGAVSDELARAVRASNRLDEAEKDDPYTIVELADELRADVEALDLRTRSKAIKDAKGDLEKFRKTLHNEIRKVLDDQGLRFSSNEKERLDQARNEPKHAEEMFRHLEKQWRDHNKLSQEAHETLEERRGELATTLKNMTIRLQSNFEAMRKAMNWNAEAGSGSLDEAGIQIRAVIHSESQTEALLNEIVEMIESDETHRQKEIEAGRSDVIPNQERYDEALKEKIRLRFYRGMFSEPEVRIRHPELRAGESYRLDDEISTGQQNAVMLMLLLKLADFAIDRDIRLQVKDARGRRLARALAQKVVIIDGLFSNLSNRELIKESLRAMSKVRGNFQLIGLIHHPQYQNDPEIFPNHIVLARMKRGRSGSYVYLEDGKAVPASDLGRHEGEIEPVSLHVDRVLEKKTGNGISKIDHEAVGMAAK